jgi:peptide/nickel transport system permease protein
VVGVHVLPNVMPTLLAYLGTDLGRHVLSYASLAFLGLGADLSEPDWGAMLFEYRGAIFEAPGLMLAPGLAVGLLALLLNWTFAPVGRGSRDAQYCGDGGAFDSRKPDRSA